MSLSVPVWWPPAVDRGTDSVAVDTSQRAPEKEKDPLKYQKRLLNWLRATDRAEDFVEWTAVEHPDFRNKKVEIGGFKPHVAMNPPADSLDSLASRHTAFLLFLAGILPAVDLVTEVEQLDDDVYRITAVVRNPGYLPTTTELGSRLRWLRKVKVGIELGAGEKLLSGRHHVLLDALAGSGGSAEVSWLVHGEKGTRLRIYAGCPMTGEKTVKITLQ
jgi:hypothetical protein